MLQFELIRQDLLSAARAGRITTGHGPVDTPAFMPVGTAGSVKGVTQEQLKTDIGASILLANTYHLFLRPGVGVLSAAGGIHRFCGWVGPFLTDSGGYQVFSMAASRKLSEEGVLFRSHIDGSRHLFTPENVVDTQRLIGADIIMALDECLPLPSTGEDTRRSMELTHRWLDRGIARMESTRPLYGYDQSFFPIVQGGMAPDLRSQSAHFIAGKDCSGYGIGGLSVGEPEEVMYQLAGVVCGILPPGKPRYLMGVGMPWNLLENMALGVDLFDCVIPTRNGRNGMLFTLDGVINIRNKKWESCFDPLDEVTPCFASRNYSRAYLRHLMISGELLGLQLATVHNLAFYLDLMRQARKHILEGDFLSWKNEMVPRMKQRL